MARIELKWIIVDRMDQIGPMGTEESQCGLSGP